MIKRIGFCLLTLSLNSNAGCCLPQTPADCFADANTVAELESLASTSMRNESGQIITRHSVRLVHAFKGSPPETFTFETIGGTLDGVTSYRSDQPTIPPAGKTFVAHLTICQQGKWHVQPFTLKAMPECVEHQQRIRTFFQNGSAVPMTEPQETTEEDSLAVGGSPNSRITSTGYSENDAGNPSRFISCDRGEPIGYLIDVIPAHLPTGMSQADAIAAVQDCLEAWADQTSLTFRYDGLSTFGQAANTIDIPDGRIRIQLHDAYGDVITASTTLGIGGGFYSNNPAPRDLSGGIVAGQGFTERKQGFLVMNHPSLTNFSEADYTEVLSHEIGHSLGLAHSSEDDNEPTAALENATMYHKVHKDGRGATLTTYDKDQIKFGYPENTPPFGSERLLRVVSGTPQPTGPGTDRVTAAGTDLQGTPVTIEHLSPYDSGPGTFSLSGDQLIYTLVGNYGDAMLSEAQLAGTSAYGRCYFRFSDGTNTSPPYTLRITGFHYDSSTSDGLPNSWMSTHFGTTSPGAIGTDRHQNSDPDGDGIDNKTERYLGTDPNDAASGPPTVTFDPTAELLTLTPTRYATHRLQTSSDLQNWTISDVFTQIDTPMSIDLDAPAPTTSEPVFYRFDFGP